MVRRLTVRQLMVRQLMVRQSMARGTWSLLVTRGHQSAV
jgi:hypothetical protein